MDKYEELTEAMSPIIEAAIPIVNVMGLTTLRKIFSASEISGKYLANTYAIVVEFPGTNSLYVIMVQLTVVFAAAHSTTPIKPKCLLLLTESVFDLEQN